jgi:hypothetical protein
MEPKCTTGELNLMTGYCENYYESAPNTYELIWSMYHNCSSELLTNAQTTLFNSQERLCVKKDGCLLDKCYNDASKSHFHQHMFEKQA